MKRSCTAAAISRADREQLLPPARSGAVALNMPIQGTAADVMKLAMVRVHDRLRREAPEAKLLLQVRR